MFILGMLVGGAIVVVALKGKKEEVRDATQEIEHLQGEILRLRTENKLYKGHYEELCKKHSDVLDKYEEIHHKNCELEKYVEIIWKQ